MGYTEAEGGLLKRGWNALTSTTVPLTLITSTLIKLHKFHLFPVSVRFTRSVTNERNLDDLLVPDDA